MSHRDEPKHEPLPGAVPPSLRRRLAILGRYVLEGMALTLVLFGVQRLFWNTSPVEQLRRAGYHWIEQRFTVNLEEPLPMTVVDISQLETTRKSGSDRKQLAALIDAIASQGASAIGVDIDFSPNTQGWIDAENDPWFFAHCLEMNQEKRGQAAPEPWVFLGVSRTQTLPPEKWLGAEEFKTLAAGLFIPRDDPRKMLEYIQANAPGEPLYSMSYRLANAYGIHRSEPWWTRFLTDWAIESLEQKVLNKAQLRYWQFWVDYSPAEIVNRERLPYEAVIQVPGSYRDRLFGKMVLIGNVNEASDVFSFENKVVPGTIIHAAAAYTLVAEAPVYDITFRGDLFLDLMLSFWVFAIVGVIWLANPGATVAVRRVQMAATILITGLALVGGVYLAASTRVMWEGFVVVLLALVLHGKAESILDRLGGWLAEGWRRVVFENRRASG